MKKKIYIRADGNAQIGLGHLVRSMAFALMLKDDFSIHFVCKHVPESIIHKIKIEGFLYTKIKEEEEFLSIVKPINIVVLDHYDLDTAFQKTIKQIGCKLICIDDLHDKEFYADLIINHAPRVKESDYQAQSYTKFALGTNYALLRPAFLEVAKEERIIDKIDTAFVCFGGADFYDLSLKSINVLLKFEQIEEINVVLGGEYKHTSIFELANENSKIKLHSDLNEITLCDLMKKCNIGIVPSSTIMYELCSVRLPIISGYFVDNQKTVYQYFKDKLFYGLDDFRQFNENKLKEFVNSILQFENTNFWRINQKYYFNGEQKYFLTKLLENNGNL